MRLVVATEEGVLELNWMWLPTWLGHNVDFRKKLEKELTPLIVGKPMTDEVLDSLHELVVSHICREFPALEGLRDYLDAIKFVRVR